MRERLTFQNRGIGRAICDSILSHPSLASSPVTLYATSRSGDDFGIVGQSNQKIIYPSLDIADPSSITAFGKTLSSVDVLINNAGINVDDTFTYGNVRKTLDTNYRGTLAMCQMILPYLGEGSRIVNVSSAASGLSKFSKEIQQRFRSAGNLGEVETLAQEYEGAVKSGQLEGSGWPTRALSYSVSKALMNSFTHVLAKENPAVLVNCCCPGWVDTDMGKQVGDNPAKTPEQGARIPVRLALGDIGGVSGRYWANDSVSGRGEGKVQDW